MNVLIVNSAAPFVGREAKELEDHLCERLNATHAVRAEVLRIPFSWEPLQELTEQIFLNCTLKLPNVDRVIALGFPAYLIPHSDKIIWLTRLCRRFDDLCEPGKSSLLKTALGDHCYIISAAEAESFSKCRRIFTASQVIRERLKRCTGFDAQVLIPPLDSFQASWPATIERLLS